MLVIGRGDTAEKIFGFSQACTVGDIVPLSNAKISGSGMRPITPLACVSQIDLSRKRL